MIEHAYDLSSEVAVQSMQHIMCIFVKTSSSRRAGTDVCASVRFGGEGVANTDSVYVTRP